MSNINYLTLLAFLLINTGLFAQKQIIVDTLNLDQIPNGEYISITFVNAFGKLKLKIDYGQKHKFFRNRVAKDEDGKAIGFYSKSHAFNVLADKGWVYINRYDYLLDSENEKKSHLFKKYN
jgi:hypothetical protein